MTTISIERLCQHHRWGTFDADPAAGEYNGLLRQYAQYENGSIGGSVVVYCAVEKPTEQILGYIALTELIFTNNSESKLYLAIPACAVSRHVRNSDIFLRLLYRAYQWVEDQSPGVREYRGIVVFSRGAISRDFLMRLGFEAFLSSEDMWFAPVQRFRFVASTLRQVDAAKDFALRQAEEGEDSAFRQADEGIKPVSRLGMPSSFISYGGPDEAFARKLHETLTAAGIASYFFPESARVGERIQVEIHRALQQYDRVILVCSAASLTRPGVLNEIQETLDREARDGGKTYLLPIMLDDYVVNDWAFEHPDLAEQLTRRVIGDFRGAAHHPERFEGAVSRLLAALRNEPPKNPFDSTYLAITTHDHPVAHLPVPPVASSESIVAALRAARVGVHRGDYSVRDMIEEGRP